MPGFAHDKSITDLPSRDRHSQADRQKWLCVSTWHHKVEGHWKSNITLFFFFFSECAHLLYDLSLSTGNNGSLTGMMNMKIIRLIYYGLHSHQTMSASALQHLHQTLIREYRIKLILSVEHHSFREPVPRNSPSFTLNFSPLINLISPTCIPVIKNPKVCQIQE